MNMNELASLCTNQIRLVGTLTELVGDSYVKNNVGVIRYQGVVECDNAYIPIKATMTSFDDKFSTFIQEFDNDVIGRKVFILGMLNSIGGVNVDYMAFSYQEEDCFDGIIRGINIDNERVLVIDNDHHSILPIKTLNDDSVYTLNEYKLSLNRVEQVENVIINDGSIPITSIQHIYKGFQEDSKECIEQALEEHEIYVEAMRQIKEGR